jgi:hypothetical protein
MPQLKDGISYNKRKTQVLVRRSNQIGLMPGGLTRFHHSEQSLFVIFRSYRRRLFTSDTSRRIFESRQNLSP